MATVTPINRPKGQCRAGLSAALDYVMQEKKIESDGRQLVTGINCQPEICYTQFISTKLQYGKCAGKMYFHFVQSFHPEENITPEEAHAVALELAQQWKDYEVIVATHTDAEHKTAAQNLGAAIGLVAGSVIAASRHKSATEPDFQSNEQTQTWQQTM